MRPLHRGQPETLQIRVPKAREAWTGVNRQRVYFQCTDDLSSLTIKPNAQKELHVFAGSGQGQDTAVVSWPVEK